MPRPDEAAAPQDEGMIDLETYEQLEAARQDARAASPPDEEGLVPMVSDERLRELKDEARRRIEDRLKTRRKQRRLMRGGDLG